MFNLWRDGDVLWEHDKPPDTFTFQNWHFGDSLGVVLKAAPAVEAVADIDRGKTQSSKPIDAAS